MIRTPSSKQDGPLLSVHLLAGDKASILHKSLSQAHLVSPECRSL